MSRLYGDDVELYDIAFDWDLGEEADWLERSRLRPFKQVAMYDGGEKERPRVEPPATGNLLWHELVRA